MCRRLTTGRRLIPLAVIAVSATNASLASGLNVNPIYLHLKREEPTTTLRLGNGGAVPMRYQLSAFAWTQDAQGEMQLNPTQEILLFPPVFALLPNEERLVRIGTTAAFADKEKTFRIFVEEFEPDAAQPGTGPALRIRTRIGLPVFLDPPAPTSTARIDAVTVGRSQISIHLKSTGNAHVHLQGVQVLAAAAPEGPSLYEHRWGPAYLLAGNDLRLTAQLPPEHCAQLRSVHVIVSTERGSIEQSVQLTPGACTR